MHFLSRPICITRYTACTFMVFFKRCFVKSDTWLYQQSSLLINTVVGSKSPTFQHTDSFIQVFQNKAGYQVTGLTYRFFHQHCLIIRKYLGNDRIITELTQITKVYPCTHEMHFANVMFYVGSTTRNLAGFVFRNCVFKEIITITDIIESPSPTWLRNFPCSFFIQCWIIAPGYSIIRSSVTITYSHTISGMAWKPVVIFGNRISFKMVSCTKINFRCYRWQRLPVQEIIARRKNYCSSCQGTSLK